MSGLSNATIEGEADFLDGGAAGSPHPAANDCIQMRVSSRNGDKPRGMWLLSNSNKSKAIGPVGRTTNRATVEIEFKKRPSGEVEFPQRVKGKHLLRREST